MFQCSRMRAYKSVPSKKTGTDVFAWTSTRRRWMPVFLLNTHISIQLSAAAADTHVTMATKTKGGKQYRSWFDWNSIWAHCISASSPAENKQINMRQMHSQPQHSDTFYLSGQQPYTTHRKHTVGTWKWPGLGVEPMTSMTRTKASAHEAHATSANVTFFVLFPSWRTEPCLLSSLKRNWWALLSGYRYSTSQQQHPALKHPDTWRQHESAIKYLLNSTLTSQCGKQNNLDHTATKQQERICF